MNPFSQWSLIEEDLVGDLASSPTQPPWAPSVWTYLRRMLRPVRWHTSSGTRDSVVTVNDTDPGITYFGDWTYVSSPGKWDYGDDVHYAPPTAAPSSTPYTGTGVDYATEKSFDQGQVDVTIDNVFQQTVKLLRPTGLVPQVAYSNKGLAPGFPTRSNKQEGWISSWARCLRIYRIGHPGSGSRNHNLKKRQPEFARVRIEDWANKRLPGWRG